MNAADEAIDLLELRGGAAYFGEAVSQREHALQAAYYAVQAGSPPELVSAALLHDAGHLLHGLPESAAEDGIDTVHEVAGYRWLLSRFGPKVAEPVRLHVDAKRYLCAVEPEYFAALSPASVRSLKLQGGPFDDAGVRAFEALPYFREAVLLRRWDDAAKVPGAAVPDLREYRGILLQACNSCC